MDNYKGLPELMHQVRIAYAMLDSIASQLERVDNSVDADQVRQVADSLRGAAMKVESSSLMKLGYELSKIAVDQFN